MENYYSKEINRYNKRVEDLIEDAEIEAEIEAETKVRSKNTQLFLIFIIGMGLLIFIYLGVNIPFEEKQLSVSKEVQISRNQTEPKPIPFLKPIESITESKKTRTKKVGISAEKNIFKSPRNAVKIQEEKLAIKDKAIKENLENFTSTKLESTIKSIALNKETPKAKINTLVKTVTIKVGSKSDIKTIKKQIGQERPKDLKQKGYLVQVGVFSLKSNADEFVKRLEIKGLSPTIQNRPAQHLMNIVFVGAYKDKKSSRESFEELRQAGFDPSLKTNGKNNYTFVLGKFKTEVQANVLRDKLSLKGFLSGVGKSNAESINYVVQLGTFQTKEEARSKQERMEQLGYKRAFIRTVG